MKSFQITILVVVFLFIVGLHTSEAQLRGLGGGALVLDDYHGHIVTLTAPVDPSPEWNAWSLTSPPFKPLTWSIPLPPSNNAQAGFIYAGPLGGATVPQLAYWLPPGQSSWSGDGNNGGYAGAWDYAGEGQLGIVSGTGTQNYVPKWLSGDTSIGNSSIVDNGTTITFNEPTTPFNVQEFAASGSDLSSSTNFINFLDASGNNRGSVQGQSYHDWTTSEDFIFSATGNALTIAQWVVALALSFATFECAALPTELPVAICTGIQLISNDVQYTEQIIQWFVQFAEVEGNLGVVYTSSSGDYAEYLRRADTTEQLSVGDIVGETNGLISKKTDGAQSVLSISRAPIVLGNTPPKGEERFYDKVGFLGQVPVKVRGEVNAGDFIIPSGFEDGTGVAVSPDAISPDQFTLVVGRAWTGSKELGIKYVTIAAGLNAKSMSEIMSREQGEIDSLKQVSIFANERLNLLEDAMLQTDPAQRAAILNQAQQLTTPTIVVAQNAANVGTQANSQQNISQNLPAQIASQNSHSQVNPPSQTATPRHGNLAARPSVQSAAAIQQSASNQLSNLISGSESSLVEKIQQTKTFATLNHAILDKIDRIVKSNDSRNSKATQIRQFFKHPDSATLQAINACVFEVIGQMTPSMNVSVNAVSTR